MDLYIDHIKCIWYNVAIMTLSEFFFKIFGPKCLKRDWHLGTSTQIFTYTIAMIDNPENRKLWIRKLVYHRVH